MLRAAPQQAALLGDGQNDILAARAAGLTEIWFSSGYGGAQAEALGPRHAIGAFDELPGVLRGL